MTLQTTLTERLRDRSDFLIILTIKLAIIGMFLPIKLSNFIMFLLLALVLLIGKYSDAWSRLKRSILPYFLLYYAIHIVGILYSENHFAAIKELDKKIPFLILPVVFSLIDPKLLLKERVNILLFFARLTIIVSIALGIYSVIRYWQTKDINVFFYTGFTDLIKFHPVYLAGYLIFATIILLVIPKERDAKRSVIRDGGIIIFSFFMLILMSSKTALFIFLVLIGYILLERITSIHWSSKILICIGFLMMSGLVIYSFPVTRARIQDSLNSNWSGILDDEYTQKASTYTGATLRFSFWKVTAKEIYSDNKVLEGVGTGDQTDYLNRVYDKHGLLNVGYVNYNLHNVLMEVILEFGLIGFAFFTALILKASRLAKTYGDNILACLLIIFILLGMTESLWNINKGIFFFTFFFCFLCCSLPTKSTCLDE